MYFRRKTFHTETTPLTSILYQLTGLYMVRVFTERNFEQTVRTNTFMSPKEIFFIRMLFLSV